MSLKGKVALVMGGGRNIGRAIAMELARQGADVAVNARANRKEAESVAEEIQSLGVKAVPVMGDIGIRADVNRVIEEVQKSLGQTDILVNAPFVRPHGRLLDITDADWERVMAVGLHGPFHAAQAVLPGMVEHRWGRIINFSGSAAFYGSAGIPHIQAGKMGIIGLTRAIALEFASYGITANVLAPGPFETERATEWPMEGTRVIPAPPRKGPGRMPPVGREGRPQEAAAACAYLVSDKAAFITGQTLHVNGGDYVS